MIYKKIFPFLFAGALFSFFPGKAQQATATGLPGDNFSLEGALALFEQSANPQQFEAALNTENNKVNNLDLDGDGKVDYISVMDKSDGDVHALVLQVSVSATEQQDIAVIEIEKTGFENAMLQIVGDADIFGEELIVEPDSGNGNDAAFLQNNFNNYMGSGPNDELFFKEQGIIVNVWMWPSVRCMFAPIYRPWISPWRWQRYPPRWHAWRPYTWDNWYIRRSYYKSRPFIVVHTHRAVRARQFYAPYRVTSVTVTRRNATAMQNYRVSRTTTVTRPAGRNISPRKPYQMRSPNHENGRTRKVTVHRRRG